MSDREEDDTRGALMKEKAYDSDPNLYSSKFNRKDQCLQSVRQSQRVVIDTILVWNWRGLGSSRKCLKSLLRKYCVGIVGILEPFQDARKMPRLASYLGFSKYCCNDSSGGKVWIYWKDVYDFGVVHMSNQALTGWLIWILFTFW